VATLNTVGGLSTYNFYASGTGLNRFDGNVLINTATNTGEKLQVRNTFVGVSGKEGPVLLVENTINQGGTANYVTFRVNAIETTRGTGSANPVEIQIDSINRVAVNDKGSLVMSGIHYPTSVSTGALINIVPTVSTALVNKAGLYGVNFYPSFENSAVILGFVYGFHSKIDIAATYTGTITDMAMFAAIRGTKAGGIVTNWYGFKCGEAATSGVNNYAFHGGIMAAVPNSWNLYMEGTADNYIRGNLLVGAAIAIAPTANVHIGAGSATTAQIRLTAGAAPTVPNDGDIWYDGTNIKIRVGVNTKTFTLT